MQTVGQQRIFVMLVVSYRFNENLRPCMDPDLRNIGMDSAGPSSGRQRNAI